MNRFCIVEKNLLRKSDALYYANRDKIIGRGNPGETGAGRKSPIEGLMKKSCSAYYAVDSGAISILINLEVFF
jgi:hypothetical protein